MASLNPHPDPTRARQVCALTHEHVQSEANIAASLYADSPVLSGMAYDYALEVLRLRNIIAEGRT